MLKSMTWYGRWIYEINGNRYLIEIKSVNNKFLNLNIKTPLNLAEKEVELRQELSKLIERWSVVLNLDFEKNSKHDAGDLNETLVKEYYEKLKSIWENLWTSENNYMSLALRMPWIFYADVWEINDDIWQDFYKAIMEVVEKFNKTRINEWKTLEDDVLKRVANIEKLLKEIEKFEFERIEKIKTRLNGNLEDFIWVEKIDRNRFEQEIIYYLEQIDFTEEKVRLAKHLNYFVETVKWDWNNGKKLDFISQEINREINTLGSKSREANIQKIVVEMKDELEKIKEQLSNIL